MVVSSLRKSAISQKLEETKLNFCSWGHLRKDYAEYELFDCGGLKQKIVAFRYELEKDNQGTRSAEDEDLEDCTTPRYVPVRNSFFYYVGSEIMSSSWTEELKTLKF